jgi:hypothetical protein
MQGPSGNRPRRATLAEIREMVGDVEAAKLEAILATGATPAEIEAALVWAEGESDVMGKSARPLEGRIAAVYEVLMTELPVDDHDL